MVDTDPDHNQHSTIAAVDGENKNVLEKPDGRGSGCMLNPDKSMNAMEALLDDQTKVIKHPEDVEVDITTRKNINDEISPEDEDPDATECSSSFADTLSDTERCSGLSEAEVESQFFDDNDLASPFDGFSGIFHTRKKLTNHWRSFIRPIMWRCKWAELRIKETESQALKYAREIAVHEQRKHPGIDESTFEGFCSKLLPFSNQWYRRTALRRRKRKRVEDTTDTALFMTDHNLFSYLENKRSNPDAMSTVDDFRNTAITDQHVNNNEELGIDNDQLFYERGDGDNSFEWVLRTIEIVHARVEKLKNQLDVVMSKNAAKFSSFENLSLLAPFEAQTSSAPSPTFSAGNGETMLLGPIFTEAQHTSGYDIGDLVLRDSAMSSYGEAIHVPDIIESTVGLLSAADVTFHQPQIGDSSEDIVDNVLIHNEAAADGEREPFIGTTSIQLVENNSQELEKGEEEESANPGPILTSEPKPMPKRVSSQEQSTLKSCLASDFQFPKNKRKRGERRAGSVGWSKQCPGRPDSQ